jgi:hypothetical protein
MAHDVFISYASQDKAVADAVCATLESRRIRCWIAPRDVLAGSSYAEAILDGINRSRLVVLVFSKNSNNSPQVMREIERAVHKGIPILPFRIEDVTPSKSMEFFVSASHWLDALTPPLARHLQKLADTVEILIKPEVHTEATLETKTEDTKKPIREKKKVTSKKPLVIALGSVLAIAIVIVAIFLLRGGGDEGQVQGETPSTTASSLASTDGTTLPATSPTTPPATTASGIPTTTKTTSPLTITGTDPGSLNVVVGQDGGNIYIDDEYSGGTTWSSFGTTVNGILPGTHTLKITAPGYKDWIKQVGISISQTTKVFVYLEPGAGTSFTRDETISSTSTFGVLNIVVGQDGGSIYIDDEYSGGTTWSSFGTTVNGLLPGTYTLKITAPGYKDWIRQVTITAGQTTKVNVYLEPL